MATTLSSATPWRLEPLSHFEIGEHRRASALGDGRGVGDVVEVGVREEDEVGLDRGGLHRRFVVLIEKRIDQQAVGARADRKARVAQPGDFNGHANGPGIVGAAIGAVARLELVPREVQWGQGWEAVTSMPKVKCVILAVVILGRIVSAAAADAPREIDARRLALAGLRALEGRYVRVVTDLPSSPGVEELPAVFDAAVPLWAEYFDVPLRQVQDARWLACVVGDREKFFAAGLMPEERPDFVSGYANGWEFWLAEQPSDYYRRHLLLHEGTHAFMQTQLGGAGAAWYMEGMAELLGTHAWRGGKLQLGVVPATREDAPMWGRVKPLRDAAAAGKAWPIERVLAVNNSRSMPPEEYAWTWLFASLLERNPQFHERFRGTARDACATRASPISFARSLQTTGATSRRSGRRRLRRSTTAMTSRRWRSCMPSLRRWKARRGVRRFTPTEAGNRRGGSCARRELSRGGEWAIPTGARRRNLAVRAGRRDDRLSRGTSGGRRYWGRCGLLAAAASGGLMRAVNREGLPPGRARG